MTTIRHSDISAATAGKLGKGNTAESVGKTVTEYSKTMVDLIKAKLPTGVKDATLVETPLCSFKVNRKESGVKRNADGSEQKVGTNYTVQVALPNFLLEALNVGIEIVKTIVDGKKKAA